MKLLQLPLLCALIVSIVLTPVAAQQKRRNPDKVPAKSPAAPAPPTFETLLSADSFKVYVEVRGVGQLIKSSAMNDVLEPIIKLGGPDKDFVEFVEWLKSHADQLTTSRLLIAAWPNAENVPPVVAAIEFSSAEEAAKFEKPLDGLLPTMFPARPQGSPEAEKKSGPQQPPPDQKPTTEQKPSAEQKPAAEQKPLPPVPGYSLQRAGSLLIVSPGPLQLKKLRSTGSKPLSEDPNFRVAYNRFASEPLFLFIDFKAVQKEQEERQKQWEEERKKAAEASKERKEKEKEDAEEQQEPETSAELQVNGEQKVAVLAAGPVAEVKTDEMKEPSQAQLASAALSSISSSLFSGTPEMPDALGVGFSPDNDSFDFRALMIDAAGKTSDPIPFFSWLKLGGPIAPQSPRVIPADSELVLTMSLDFQQLYARMSAPTPAMVVRGSAGEDVTIDSTTSLAGLEKLLKIKIKDDLLPLLGSEVAVSLPLVDYNPFAPPRSAPTPQPKDEAKPDSTANSREPFIVMSLRDKEGMRKLLPKIIEGFAGNVVAALAQTERREDTELVSYANTFAYAFIGDFLVLSTDPAATRHVVDSYLKGATLAGDVPFRNYTRWQPHELQGQVYVSPAFMESYKTWANNPNSRITDEARAFFTHLTTTAQPITYSLSNDGLGTLHELHIPKSVLLLAIGGAAAAENPPPTLANERVVMNALWKISYTEHMYKEKNSGYGSLEELIAADMISKELLEDPNYKFEFAMTADGYTVSAVPTEYGKTGKLSFFLDQTGVVHAADHGGAPASASDPAASY
jgi:hypothetical protein